MNINLFWFDGGITKMEMLTLKSILHLNYIPVVWSYNKDLFKNIDDRIIIMDANDIIPKNKSFIYKGGGTTRPSFGCGFTDIFRAKLLYEIGGWYSDFDITFLDSLKEFEDKEFVFRKHNITAFVPNLIKAPAKHDFLKDLYVLFNASLNENNQDFFKPLKIFSNLIEKYNFVGYGVNEFGNDDVNYIIPLFVKTVTCNYKAIHWCNELFKNVGYDISSLKTDLNTISLIKKNDLIKDKKIYFNWNKPVRNSFYERLLNEYKV